jgi:hypothetical protein
MVFWFVAILSWTNVEQTVDKSDLRTYLSHIETLCPGQIMKTQTANTLRPMLWTALLFSAGWAAMWHGTARADACPHVNGVQDSAAKPGERTADAGMSRLLIAHWASTGAPVPRLPLAAGAAPGARP